MVTRLPGCLALIVAGLAMAPLAGHPFAGLNPGEAAALSRGEAVVRSPSSADKLIAPAGAPGSAELLAAFKKLRPNYLVEVFASSRSGSDRIGGAFLEALTKPEAWVGIPYRSTRKAKTYDLYDLSATISRTGDSGGGRFDARHHMEPFEDYTARYEYSVGAESLVFSGSTTSALIYKGVRAVGPGGLIWRIVAWKSGTEWYFYGVGGVKAFDFFGAARDRLEPSFIGRTRAFFEFMKEEFSR